MSGIWLAVFGLGVFFLGFRFYSKYIAERVYRLDPNFVTPAHQFNDGVDFVPTNKWVLWGHHFTSVAGAAPIVKGEIVEDPQTIASAIRIGNPASWRFAVEARDESGGAIDSVTDDEIIAAYQRMASEEGLFCEPASAASVAGLIKAAEWTDFRNETCVCVITGMGLKDPETAAKAFPFSELSLPANLAAIEEALAPG